MADIRWSRKTIAVPDTAVRTPKAREAVVPSSMLRLAGRVIKTPAIRMTETVTIPETVVRRIARPITKREVVHRSSTRKRAAKATKIANYLIVV